MKSRRRRSMAWGLTISLVLSVAVVSTLTLAFHYVTAMRSSRAELEVRSDELTSQLADGLGPQLWNFDSEGMESIANSFFQNELVVDLRIKDNFGNTLFNRTKPHGPDTLERGAEIHYQGKMLGQVSIRFTARFHQEYGRELLVRGLATLLAVLLALIILTRIFLRIFLRPPLDSLGAVVKAYTDGRYDFTPPTPPPGEFQPLINVLGKMGSRITTQMEELTEAEANYRAIFENTVEGLFQASPRGELVNANPAAVKIMGFDSLDEFLASGADLPSRMAVSPQERRAMFRSLQKGRAITNLDMRLLKRDRSLIWASLNLRPLFNDSGRLVSVEGSIEDIGMRKQAEQTLLEAKEAAESASQLMSQLLSTVSHELRTPMTSILGFSKLINRDLAQLHAKNPEMFEECATPLNRIRSNLNIIIEESDRLTRLINDVLDLAKLESGGADWKLEPAAPGDLVTRALAATSSLVDGSSVFLTASLPEDLPLVQCDRERIIQVLINLLSNAVKFTPKGEILCAAEVSGGMLRFSVSDSGVGIPLQHQDQIFSKFKQLGDTLKDKPSGTGLGLAICKEIVDRHKGRIWVESAPGRGSRFNFTLPF